jgi:hypothetical protein
MSSIVRNPAERASDRPLIFSVNTGRCGTHTITAILDDSPRVHAEHEADPAFSDLEYMINPHEPDYLQAYADKVTSIHDELPDEGSFYADPTNMFAKSWGMALLRHSPDFSEIVRLIYGHRSLTDMTRSYFEWGYVPGRHSQWMLPVQHSRNVFEYPFEVGWKKDTPEARHVWYGFEMYFRALKIMDRYPEIPVVEFGTEDFGSGVAETLFEWLDLPVTDEAESSESTRRNTTPDRFKDNPIKSIREDLVEQAYDVIAEKARSYEQNFRSSGSLPFPTP